MPRCKKCGNNKSLASTLVHTEEKTANPPPYGLTANFTPDGAIYTMECQGASLDEAQEAYENPVKYFNTCPQCGYDDILW